MTVASKCWRRRCCRSRSRLSAAQSRRRDACFTRLLRPRRPRKCYDAIACDLAEGTTAAGSGANIGCGVAAAAAGIMRQSNGAAVNGIAGNTTASEERRRVCQVAEVVVVVDGDGENDDAYVANESGMMRMIGSPIML